jgi:hypothetical protein
MTLPKIYCLARPKTPWGDYGDILFNGMASRSKAGVLQLERTGPFVPPISQPNGFVVVTGAFLEELQQSVLTGFDVGKVKKKKVPLVDWRSWTPYGPKKMKYPVGGEPENYIEFGEHSGEAAKDLGELFDLQFRPGIEVSRDGGYHLVAESWSGQDFFVAKDEMMRDHFVFVSKRARLWLLDRVSEWIAFEKHPVR